MLLSYWPNPVPVMVIVSPTEADVLSILMPGDTEKVISVTSDNAVVVPDASTTWLPLEDFGIAKEVLHAP